MRETSRYMMTMILLINVLIYREIIKAQIYYYNKLLNISRFYHIAV